MRFEPLDLVLILIVAVLLFGPKRLPELARAVGQSISEFKHAMVDDGRHPADGAAHSASANQTAQPQRED